MGVGIIIAKRRSVKILNAEFVYESDCNVFCDQHFDGTVGSQRTRMSVH
jgi:hypothetical protein